MSSGKHFDIVDIVYATFRPFDELWTDTDKRRWVTMTDKNLDEMTSIVKDAICDQSRPKNIRSYMSYISKGGRWDGQRRHARLRQLDR